MDTELKVISDTGDESSFQVTEIYNEQFKIISNVIQEHYDYFVSKIDNEFKDLYTELITRDSSTENKIDNYNLKIIDLLHDVRINTDIKIEDEGKKLITVWYDKFNELRDKIIDYNLNAHMAKDHFNVLLDTLRQDLVETKKMFESTTDYLKLEQVDLMTVIQLAHEEINKLRKEIKELRDCKQDIIIKKPWYKRIFSNGQ